MSEKIPLELVEFRRQIDALDRELIDVLARRIDVVRSVGAMKMRENMDVVQPQRARAVKDRAVEMGVDVGLDAGFVGQIYDALIDHAHDLEHEILKDQV